MINKSIINKLEKREDFDIYIGDLKYRVIFNSNVTKGNHNFGETHSTTQIIYLDETCNIDKLRNTFIHEVLHGIIFTSGLCREEYMNKEEEKIVRTFAEHINLFLLLNNIE